MTSAQEWGDAGNCCSARLKALHTGTGNQSAFAFDDPGKLSFVMPVQVKDATLGPLGASFGRLGEGNVRVQDLFRRLMGIGYDGWVSFEWEKAWLPNIAGPEEALPAGEARGTDRPHIY